MTTDEPPRPEFMPGPEGYLPGAAPAGPPDTTGGRPRAGVGVASGPKNEDHALADARGGGRHEAPRRAGPSRGSKRGGSFARELPFLVLVAFALALLIKAFLVQAFWIPSGSMERTLLINDRVLVNKVVYDFRHVHRGEIVVFNGDGTGFESAEETETTVAPPSNALERGLRDVQSLLGLGAPSNKDFIKRVIGIGGDTVACCDAQGRVTVNGHPLTEPYIYQDSPQNLPTQYGGRTFAPVKVPAGDLFVMGDHRSASSDSRAHGVIPEDKVVGRAFVRAWPLNRFAFLRVPTTFQHSLALGAPAIPGLLGAAFVLPLGLARSRRRRLSRRTGASSPAVVSQDDEFSRGT